MFGAMIEYGQYYKVLYCWTLTFEVCVAPPKEFKKSTYGVSTINIHTEIHIRKHMYSVHVSWMGPWMSESTVLPDGMQTGCRHN